METKSFEEKIAAHRGPYTLDFSKKEDCDYFLKDFGSEENLQQNFPTIHKNFVKTRQNAEEKASLKRERANTLDVANETTEDKEKEIFRISAGEISCTKNIVTNLSSFEQSDGVRQIQSALKGVFIDPDKEINDKAAASPWVGITLTTRVVDKATRVQLSPSTSYVFQTSNEIAYTIRSEPKVPATYENKLLNVTYTVQARDPNGNLMRTIESRDFVSGQVSPIAYIEVDHPTENVKGQKNKIIMLYGRSAERESFKSCDYGGEAKRSGIDSEDFLKNTFVSPHVHLILPLKGSFALNNGFTAVGLDDNCTDPYMSRPVVAYDYKGQLLYYRGKEDNFKVYEQVKKCFVIRPEKDSNGRTVVDFDIKHDIEGRSKYDWNVDIEGTQDGRAKEIKLSSGFAYVARYDGLDNKDAAADENPIDLIESIEIESIAPDQLAALNREYYKSVPGSNTIYIPPIVIYWGCFGRDSLIKCYDGTLKKASEIRIGDTLVNYEGKKLVVDNVFTGNDETIYHIKTDKGETKVSVGHPFMCDGERIKACNIKAGDKLAIEGGEVATVLSNDIVPYNDTVYNFTFAGEEDGNYLIGDGFLSGDLYMQNAMTNAEPYVLTDEENDFVEEMQRFSQSVNDSIIYGTNEAEV